MKLKIRVQGAKDASASVLEYCAMQIVSTNPIKGSARGMDSAGNPKRATWSSKRRRYGHKLLLNSSSVYSTTVAGGVVLSLVLSLVLSPAAAAHVVRMFQCGADDHGAGCLHPRTHATACLPARTHNRRDAEIHRGVGLLCTLQVD